MKNLMIMIIGSLIKGTTRRTYMSCKWLTRIWCHWNFSKGFWLSININSTRNVKSRSSSLNSAVKNKWKNWNRLGSSLASRSKKWREPHSPIFWTQNWSRITAQCSRATINIPYFSKHFHQGTNRTTQGTSSHDFKSVSNQINRIRNTFSNGVKSWTKKWTFSMGK